MSLDSFVEVGSSPRVIGSDPLLQGTDITESVSLIREHSILGLRVKAVKGHRIENCLVTEAPLINVVSEVSEFNVSWLHKLFDVAEGHKSLDVIWAVVTDKFRPQTKGSKVGNVRKLLIFNVLFI